MISQTSRPSTPLIRLVHPQAFAGFLNTLGAPTHRLFRRAGLPVYCDDPSAFVPLQRAWALFDAAAQSTDVCIGWHVGRFHGDKSLSAALLQKLEHAPTLYQALKRLVQLVSVEASHLELGIQERRDDIVFFTRYSTLKDWPGYPCSQSYQLEMYVDLIRHYLGANWTPKEMGIEHPVVPAVAEEHFPDTRILPNQPMGYLTVPRSSLHRPPRSVASESLDRGQMVLSRDFDFVETLKAIVRAYLPDGYPSARQTADLMHMSPRTLMRRLRERGQTYQSVIDSVRFQQATRLLQDSDWPITRVATSVGFNDPAHFARMFRRIGGSSPTQFRRSVSA